MHRMGHEPIRTPATWSGRHVRYASPSAEPEPHLNPADVVHRPGRGGCNPQRAPAAVRHPPGNADRPGGIGKTRLALQAMETVRSNTDEAAAWVSLAPVRDPHLVLPTIASALQVPETADVPIIEQLTTFLARQPMLLVLDNLEHVIDAAAPVIAELLRSCPGLTVLATSRNRLGISGEQVTTGGSPRCRDRTQTLLRPRRVRRSHICENRRHGAGHRYDLRSG